MAYVGNNSRLCQDIVDGELEHVRDWLSQDEADPNTRDYTGRTPLHLAAMSSTPEIVQCLVDAGARLVARLADGRTALHLAAERGSVEIVKILLDKSAANEAEEDEKQAQKKEKTAETVALETLCLSSEKESLETESDVDLVDDAGADEDDKSFATGSFVKVKKEENKLGHEGSVPEENEDGPDIYDVNVVAWDMPTSALHLAIVCGHEEVVKLLCQVSELCEDIQLDQSLTRRTKNTGIWRRCSPSSHIQGHDRQTCGPRPFESGIGREAATGQDRVHGTHASQSWSQLRPG